MILKLLALAVFSVFMIDTFNSQSEFTSDEKYLDVSFDTESQFNEFMPFLQISKSKEPYCYISYKTAGKELNFGCGD